MNGTRLAPSGVVRPGLVLAAASLVAVLVVAAAPVWLGATFVALLVAGLIAYFVRMARQKRNHRHRRQHHREPAAWPLLFEARDTEPDVLRPDTTLSPQDEPSGAHGTR